MCYIFHEISTSQPIAQILRTLTRATRMDPHCPPGAWNMTAISDGWSAGMRQGRCDELSTGVGVLVEDGLCQCLPSDYD